MDLPGYRPRTKGPPETALKSAAELINRAERPVILAGHGILISGAMGQVRELAERARIPIAMTLLGIGAIPANHSLNMGMMGMHGESWVNQAIQEADLLLALGMRFDDRVTGSLKTYAPNAAKIHIDIDPAEFHKNVRVDVALAGDLSAVLAHLLPVIEARDRSEWLGTIRGFKGDTAVRDIQNLPDMGKLYAAHVIHDIWRMTGGKAIVTTDVGQHQMWEAQYYRHNEPRSLITSGGLGTMGFALPAAVGAKVARPDDEVWVIAGDGGFQMTMCELATIAQERLKLNVAIINNGYLGMVRQWQEFFYDRRYAGTPILSPDFAALARSVRPRRRSGEDPAGGRGRGRARPGRRAHGGARLPGREGGHRVPHGPDGRPPAGHDPAARAGGRGRPGVRGGAGGRRPDGGVVRT